MGDKTTSVFLADAGVFGGIYDRDIPIDECLECGANGMNIGLKGMEDRLIINQLALGRVIAIDPLDPDADDIIVLADEFNSVPFNSPNDIALSPDRKSVYFTDPTFG